MDETSVFPGFAPYLAKGAQGGGTDEWLLGIEWDARQHARTAGDFAPRAQFCGQHADYANGHIADLCRTACQRVATVARAPDAAKALSQSHFRRAAGSFHRRVAWAMRAQVPPS